MREIRLESGLRSIRYMPPTPQSIIMVIDSDPRFGPSDVPEAGKEEEYVSWIDIMGTSSVMREYPDVAEVNVGKFHVAIAQYSKEDSLCFYPVIDGIYAVSEDEEPVIDFSKYMLGRFSENLRKRAFDSGSGELIFGPLVRCGIASGEVHHWNQLKDTELAEHPHRNNLVTGDAVAKAHQAEREASPLGIEMDHVREKTWIQLRESINWWGNPRLAVQTRAALKKYWNKYIEQDIIPYDTDRMQTHAKKADEYFPTESSEGDTIDFDLDLESIYGD